VPEPRDVDGAGGAVGNEMAGAVLEGELSRELACEFCLEVPRVRGCGIVMLRTEPRPDRRPVGGAPVDRITPSCNDGTLVPDKVLLRVERAVDAVDEVPRTAGPAISPVPRGVTSRDRARDRARDSRRLWRAVGALDCDRELNDEDRPDGFISTMTSESVYHVLGKDNSSMLMTEFRPSRTACGDATTTSSDKSWLSRPS